MAANSGLPEGTSFSWGEMWTPLNWLCIDFSLLQVMFYICGMPQDIMCV